ncbi:MAG TPA: ATP-binding cassette domain-containing protein [Bacteroidales bacterium]|nr:ATP-binding cassette domain-containing protein [Bacteroidales bacterium]
MNDKVLNLAIRSAALLRSIFQNNIDKPDNGAVSKYFARLGVNPDDAEQVYIRFSGNGYTPKDVQNGEPVSLLLYEDLCKEINTSLRYNEKVYLLLLVQDCLLKMNDVPGFSEQLNLLFNCIGIDNTLIDRFRDFLEQDDPAAIVGRDYLVLAPRDAMQDDELEGRWIDSNAPRKKDTAHIIEIDEFKSHVLVMFVDQIKSFVVRCMSRTGQLYDQKGDYQCTFRVLGPGNELILKGVPVLTYSGLKNRFHHLYEKGELSLIADQIEYRSPKGIKEVNSFTVSEVTGQLIGIVGKEGVGKSTLLKLLAGKIKPDAGFITINGYDLWKHKYLLKGIIGYVPEEDLLYEELTVSDNLALTARLYYSYLDKHEIDAKVNKILSRLDLLDLKHVVVGGVLSKHIQPGQRRMINIALELLREPQILLVDNALSGLGMADATKVIKVLHDYSFDGNLVITNISQADSKTFLFFDKIWIFDEGGRILYNGQVKSAPEYLHRQLKLAYHETPDVDPSQLLDLVNYKLPDPEGNVWKRMLQPQQWHDQYIREQVLRPNGIPEKTLLPARILKIPNLEIQLLIFSIRNFKCKFKRISDIVKVLLTGPVVALLISLIFRLETQGSYTFYDNVNIPLYQFLSVVIAVFFGLVLSANEIIKEKNVLEKEEYLEFSRFSYINSKILYLFPVIAIQTFLYVLTGNLVLGISDFLWVYWLVLFSSACFGIMLGLIFSSSAGSTGALYERILPLVIALQVLLGGGIIPYEHLNLGKGRYTPVLGDLMISRWGYEILAVEQYSHNKYQKMLYDADKKLSQASFYAFQVIPKLEQSLTMSRDTQHPDSVKFNTSLLQHELIKIASLPDVFPFEYLNDIAKINEDDNLLQETDDYLTYLSMYFYEQHENLVGERNRLLEKLEDSIGVDQLAEMKLKYANASLERIVTNRNTTNAYIIAGTEIIPKTDLIFREPSSFLGRACLYYPVKLFNLQKTSTIWFNLSVIWSFSSILYLLLLSDAYGLVRKLLRAGFRA